MGRSKNDIHPGDIYGRLMTLRYLGHCKWECSCSCGKEVVVRSDHLRSGDTRSCGCLCKEEQSVRARTHGQRNTRLYQTWLGMRFRCENPKSDSYKNYGGRGIRVCEEWQRFEPFFEWAMTHGYSDELTIDRIDVNGNYEPSNCRWADNFTQHYNTRKTRYLTVRGQRKSIGEWCRITGLPRELVYDRVFRSGWSAEQALSLPLSQGKRIGNGKRKENVECF